MKATQLKFQLTCFIVLSTNKGHKNAASSESAQVKESSNQVATKDDEAQDFPIAPGPTSATDHKGECAEVMKKLKEGTESDLTTSVQKRLRLTNSRS